MTLLYLDIDGPLPDAIVYKIVATCRLWDWRLAGVRFDRTRNGWHVVVAVRKRLPPVVVVAAQAILGSHDKREAYNLLRVMQLDRVPRFWRRRWNVLYSSHRKPRPPGDRQPAKRQRPRSVA